MFVSIAIDPGSEGRARELGELLSLYGFKKIQRGVWESATVVDDDLRRIKRDIDRATDAFDKIRIFQFPFEGSLVISSLVDKKWRRLVAKGEETIVVPKVVTRIPARARIVKRKHIQE